MILDLPSAVVERLGSRDDWASVVRVEEIYVSVEPLRTPGSSCDLGELGRTVVDRQSKGLIVGCGFQTPKKVAMKAHGSNTPHRSTDSEKAIAEATSSALVNQKKTIYSL